MDHLLGSQGRELHKQMLHTLMYGSGVGAFNTAASGPPAPLVRYRMIVEVEVTATSEMAARRHAKNAFTNSLSDTVTVLMCEPIVGGATEPETKV